VVLPVLAAQIPVRPYGIGTTDMVLPLTVLYSMTMVGSIAGGWWPSVFINKRRRPVTTRA
jgi:ACS family hexuronate transporter-like MFS transporter